MIRINDDTPIETLINVKIGDLVTDTYSKTGTVEKIDKEDDGLYLVFIYTLITGRTITVRR